MSRTRFCPLPLRLIFVIVHEKSTRSFNAEFDASALIACVHMHGVMSARAVAREKNVAGRWGVAHLFIAREAKEVEGLGGHRGLASEFTKRLPPMQEKALL